jgi:hypothetical protein
MVQFTNFYENLTEARLRLLKNIVSYEGEAYYVLEIVDHPDGKFRIYMDKLGDPNGIGRNKHGEAFPKGPSYEHNYSKLLDNWIEKNPDSGVVRKYMSSRGFNKFRPFPLGNLNSNGSVIYVQRTPTRNTNQGLRENSVVGYLVSATPKQSSRSSKSYTDPSQVGVSPYTCAFADMVAGNYPDYWEVIKNLCNPKIANQGCAFDRDFSVLRGPVDLLCLCYQTDGIGLIDARSNKLILGHSCRHLLEQIQELNIFTTIEIQ